MSIYHPTKLVLIGVCEQIKVSIKYKLVILFNDMSK